MFLFFVLLSFLFWLLINLSKEYISTAQFKVSYVNLSKARVLQNTPLDKLKLEIKAHGFKFLTYQFKKKKIQINLAYLQHLKENTYFYLPNNHLRDFQAQFSKDVEILGVEADTLFFELTFNAKKKVKITPNLDITFKSGYNLNEPISISSDSVVIQGPKTFLDTINEVKTAHLQLKGLAENFKKDIALKMSENSKLSYSFKSVVINIIVDKFTETTLVKNFEIINLPKSQTITTIPKEVTVKYQVSLSNFNRVSASMFTIQCDYAVSERDSLSYLIPKVIVKPAFVSSVTLTPKRIEYLIKK
ncbi:MAG: YbbR-like domain-containing protein [Flavobacteriaceae bacterium]|nr:YbbR-like domain-containing protein [Flavobacteriaceae bacterium]